MAKSKTLLPHIVIVSGRHAGQMVELPFGDHVLGRGGEASIQLDDGELSRRHARVVVTNESVTIEDLESKNGVTVRGKRVEGPTALRHGDSLAFGKLNATLSHPASQVEGALAKAGEATVTMTSAAQEEEGRSLGLLVPLVGVAVFGGLVAALLLL